MQTSLDSVVGGSGADFGSMASFKADLARSAAQQEETKKFVGEKIKKIEDTPLPSPPKIVEPPKPADYQTDPMQTFGSAAMFLGQFGSLFTKRPMQSALSSGAAVMNAVHAKDADGFKQAMEKFKVDTENAKSAADYQLKLYDAMVGKQESEIKAYLGASKDEVGQRMMDIKMFQMHEKAARENAKNFISGADDFLKIGQDAYDKVIKAGGTENEAIMAKMSSIGNAKNISKKGDNTLTEEEYGQKYKNDPQIAQLAESYAKGATIQQIVPGWSKDNPKRDAVIKKAYELHPELNWADAHTEYLGEQSGARSLNTQTKKIELASNMLDTSLPSMLEAAKKVGLSESTDLNTLYNTAKRHMSNKDFSNFSTQLRAVTSDYAQFIGRGRMTVHSDQEALRILNEDMGITALDGFVEAVNTERSNVQRAIEMTKGHKPAKEVKLKPSDRSIDLLKGDPSPEARQEFDDHYYKGASAEILGE